MHRFVKVAVFLTFCGVSVATLYLGYYRQQRLKCEATTEPAEARLTACDVSCRHGDANHCYWLAQQLDKKDPARAAQLYRHVCDAEIVSGCVGIGHLLMDGRGVSKDVAEANRLLSRACDEGAANACSSIGYSYSEGIGVAKDYTKAAALYLKSCDGGSAVGCYNLAQLLNSPNLGNQHAKSVEYYKRACERSEMMACSMLGSLYAEGRGVEKDYIIAEKLLRKSCESGERDVGCGELAMFYNHGWGVGKDLEQAKQLFQKSCDSGNEISCDHLANLLEDSNDVATALTLRKKACDKGLLSSCGSLAHMYLEGLGVAKDIGVGTSLYRRACDGGDSDSCNAFGVAYEYGKGVALDYEKAAALYTKACEMNNVFACGNLGSMYIAGSGVTKDIKRGLQFYERACDAKDLDSCDKIGRAFQYGLGVKPDLAKAISMYKKSCDGDLAAGCNDYATMFYEGKGVARNFDTALAMYEKSCAGGDRRGCSNAAILWKTKDRRKSTEFDARACKLGQEDSCTLQAKALIAQMSSPPPAPTVTELSRRGFKAAVACLDNSGVDTKSSRMPANNGSVEMFSFSAASKTVLLMELDRSDVLKGAVMIMQPGADLTSAVTVFSMLGGCLTGLSRQQVTATLLRPDVSALGGAFFLRSEGSVQKMAVAWTERDVRSLAK